MQNVVYSEWVPAGTLTKTLAGSVCSLTLCVLLITIALGVAIQNPFFIVVLASVLAFVLFFILELSRLTDTSDKQGASN